VRLQFGSAAVNSSRVTGGRARGCHCGASETAGDVRNDDFGTPLPGTDPTRVPPNWFEPRFLGRDLDRTTGFYLTGSRFYDPVAQTYLSADASGSLSDGANPYIFEKNNPVNEPAKDNYWLRTFRQVILGDWTDDVTLAGTGVQVAAGFTGVDIIADIRDIGANLWKWEWSWSHVGKTAVSALAVLPVIGIVKYSDEAVTILKGAKIGDAPVELTEDALKMLRNGLRGGNGPKAVLDRNSTYRIGDQVFETDRKGRLARTMFTVDADALRQGKRIANSNDTRQIGALGRHTDVGFHLRADALGGSKYYPNVVPASKGLNTGAYKQLEEVWQQAAENGRKVDISIELAYSWWRIRPNALKVKMAVDGVSIPRLTIANRGTASVPEPIMRQLRLLTH
jgi:RHS repeat-associated protein